MEPKKYDLEERTLQFAIDCRLFLKKLPKTISNSEDGEQLVRSSGSVGANYIEANEALSKKDFNYKGLYKETIISAILEEEYNIKMSSDAIKKSAYRYSKSIQVQQIPKDIRDI